MVCRVAPEAAATVPGRREAGRRRFSGTISVCASARCGFRFCGRSRAWKAAGTTRRPREARWEAPEAGGSGEKHLKENQIQLPKVKRSAELTFTCNKCEHRTTRKVNPEVYKKGTMFVQCAGCAAWHKMVDNLGLMYEFPAEEQ